MALDILIVIMNRYYHCWRMYRWRRRCCYDDWYCYCVSTLHKKETTGTSNPTQFPSWWWQSENEKKKKKNTASFFWLIDWLIILLILIPFALISIRKIMLVAYCMMMIGFDASIFRYRKVDCCRAYGLCREFLIGIRILWFDSWAMTHQLFEDEILKQKSYWHPSLCCHGRRSFNLELILYNESRLSHG